MSDNPYAIGRRFPREILKAAARALFESGGSLEPIRELLAEARARLERGYFDPGDVCIRATLSKPLNAYAGHNTPHLAAARRLREELGVELGPGESVEYYIARGSGPKYARAKPVQFFKHEDVDILDVLNETYKLVARLVSAALGISPKKAFTMLMHREIVTAEHRKAKPAPKGLEDVREVRRKACSP